MNTSARGVDMKATATVTWRFEHNRIVYTAEAELALDEMLNDPAEQIRNFGQ